jgi:hypothetical protein
MADGFVDLYWLPVAAGTLSPVRRWSLACWEWLDAKAHRRRPGALYHAALKLGLEDGATYTLELTPAFVGNGEQPLMTGPVGVRGADRFRFFRYQLLALCTDWLPDEDWTVAYVRLGSGSEAARRVLALAPSVPKYTWGWRAPGTHEMWTSDSVISWLLVRADLGLDGVTPPADGRAPGWFAGIEAAKRGVIA